MTPLCAVLSLALAAPLLAEPVTLFDEDPPASIEIVALTGAADASLDVVGAQGDVEPADGDRMLRLRVRRTDAAGAAHAYVRFWKGRHPVTPNTRLSYCVFADLSSTDASFAVDLEAPDFYPDNLRDQPAAVDQNGIRAHPYFGQQSGRNVGQWYYREISLACVAGKEVTGALAAWDDGQGGREGEVIGYFDEVFLWEAGDAGEERARALREMRGWEPPPADPSAYPPASRLGGWRELPPFPPQVEDAEQRERRGQARLAENGYFAFDDGEAYLPWGLFGSEIYTGLHGDDTGATGPCVWWSHVPDAGGPGHNSEPQEITEQDWRDYFAYCRTCGVTALRLFTYGYTPDEAGYYFALDAVGKVHPVLWRKLDRFMQVGYESGIRFLFTLLASPDWMPYVTKARPHSPEHQVLHEAQRQYTEGELADLSPPRRKFLVAEKTVEIKSASDNQAFFEDSDIALCVESYLRDLLPRLANDPRVFALEIMNETLPLNQAAWASEHVTRLCRELAPGRPVTLSHTMGGGVQQLEHAAFARAAGLDLYNWHAYLAPNTPATTALALNCLYYNAPVPGFPTEGPAYYGGRKPDDTDERLRRLAIRDYLWLPLVTGCPGSILWAPENGGIAPTEWHELRTFHQALAQITPNLDFARLHRRQPQVGLSVWLSSGLRAAYSEFLLRLGVPFAFAEGQQGFGRFVSEPTRVAELVGFRTPVRAIGSNIAPTLIDEGERNVVAYLPNDVRRTRGNESRRVEGLLDLRGVRYHARVLDLDARRMAEAELAGRSRLLIAEESAHDFVLCLSAVQ